MSQLIDSIVMRAETFTETQSEELPGRWFVAKPISLFSLRYRLRDAWRVLRGKAFAVHYARDSTDTIWR